MSIFQRIGPSLRIAFVLPLAGIACTTECVFPPCVFPVAVEVVVRADGSGRPVANAYVRERGAVVDPKVPCTGEPAVCEIRGVARTYNLEIGAPGFATITRLVVVAEGESSCGCPSASLERLDVALPPAPSGS